VTPSPSLSTKQRVTALLAEQLRLGKVQMVHIARAMNVSEATLRRRLLQEGTSFSELVESTRFELAQRYLRDSTFQLEDVAFLLGFRDIESFSEAFLSWSGGNPPSAYRSS
jgi:AraC-like DNA-binding protein